MLFSEEEYISEEYFGEENSLEGKINQENNTNNQNNNECPPCKPCSVPENEQKNNNGILNNTINNIKTATNSPTASLIGFFWTILGLFAIFLSFKCNEQFSLLGFLGAFLFSPFYVAYKLGTKWDVCMAGIIN